MSRLRWHFRCIVAVASSYVLGTRMALSVVGFVCRRILGLPIASVFLLYPARKEYADALAYRWHQRRFGWQPGLVGFYRQGRRYGLIFGIPNLEDEIRAPESADRVLTVMSRMEAIQRRVGAPRKVFAGILPSTLARNGAEDQHLAQQRHLTARAVLQALDHVMELNGLTRDVRILVLGGRGYIASEVIRLGTGLRITSIDADGWDEFRQFAAECRGSAVVVLNLTKSGALLEYARELWPGVIVLNEVYPEPSPSEIAELERRGARCYHIVGVAGSAWPRFPRAYRGAIPCCASLPISPTDHIPVIVARLTGDAKPDADRTLSE